MALNWIQLINLHVYSPLISIYIPSNSLKIIRGIQLATIMKTHYKECYALLIMGMESLIAHIKIIDKLVVCSSAI